MNIHKPVTVVLSFEPDHPPIPSNKLADELTRRFPELMKMPPAQRRIEIDKIWDQYKERV